VGLEFETAVPVRNGDGTKLGYKDAVWNTRGDDWCVEADSSNLEFVTTPFAQSETGRQELSDTMDEITAWVGRMRTGIGAAVDHKPTVRSLGAAAADDVMTVGPNSRVTAAPQATGGLALDKLPDLLRTARTTRLDHLRNNTTGTNRGRAVAPGKRQMMGMNPADGHLLNEAGSKAKRAIDRHKTVMRRAGKDIPGHGFKKLEGLMGLVISYILKGQRQTAVWKYSKLIAPLMSRVDFHAMYGVMEDDEKALFTKDFVLGAAGSVAAGASLYKKGFAWDKVTDINKGPKCGDWIDSIVAGTDLLAGHVDIDLMSDGGGHAVTTGHSGSCDSLGAMHEPDENPANEDAAELAIVELRRLPKGQYYTMWKQTALTVFDYFQALTDG